MKNKTQNYIPDSVRDEIAFDKEFQKVQSALGVLDSSKRSRGVLPAIAKVVGNWLEIDFTIKIFGHVVFSFHFPPQD